MCLEESGPPTAVRVGRDQDEGAEPGRIGGGVRVRGRGLRVRGKGLERGGTEATPKVPTAPWSFGLLCCQPGRTASMFVLFGWKQHPFVVSHPTPSAPPGSPSLRLSGRDASAELDGDGHKPEELSTPSSGSSITYRCNVPGDSHLWQDQEEGGRPLQDASQAHTTCFSTPWT